MLTSFSSDLSDYEVIIEELDSDTLDTLGTFNVILKNGDKEYQTKITVQDTLSPILELREVTITEGDEITIDSFIASCTDNSQKKCSYAFVDEENNEIESIDSSVGEHTIYVIAKDELGNISNIESTKLIVNKKLQEKSANSSNTTTNSKSSNNNNNNTSSSQSSKRWK